MPKIFPEPFIKFHPSLCLEFATVHRIDTKFFYHPERRFGSSLNHPLKRKLQGGAMMAIAYEKCPIGLVFYLRTLILMSPGFPARSSLNILRTQTARLCS